MKKIFALALSLIMVLSMLPTTALALETPSSSDYSAWSDGETVSTGTYDLGGATVTITGTLTVDGAVTVKNGTIKRASGFDGEMFAVGNGDSLTLENITVDGNKENQSGDSIIVIDNGTVTLGNGAVLTNNKITSVRGRGSAVTVTEGTLNINGGKITNNEAYSDGGSTIKTYYGSTVNMTGGEISNNSGAKHGGAIQLYGADAYYESNKKQTVFNMSGGTITKNSCSGVGGGVAVSQTALFDMTGGSITENSCGTDGRGGGVAFSENASNNIEMSISGDAVISGNKKGSSADNNLEIGTANTLTVGTMGDNADVGVTMSGSPGVFSSGGASYTSKFKSDNAAYIVVADGGNLKLVEASTTTYTVTFDANGHGTAPSAQSSIAAGGKVTEPTPPTEDGWRFDGWYKEQNCTTAWNFDTDTVTSDITLYAKWEKEENTYTVTFDANGGSGTMDAMTNEASVEFTYPACTFTAPAGKQFKGWSTDAESIEVILVGTKHNLNGGDHLSLYAIWETIEDSTQQPADKYTISGKVVEKATDAPVTGAKVELKLGDKEIATTTTDENGSFRIENKPAGNYNVVVSKDGKIVTILVELTDDEVCEIVLPEQITNSVVEHVTPEGFTAGTLVGGLDKVAQNLREQLSNATDTDIEVKLIVEEQKTDGSDETVKEQQKEIKKLAGSKKMNFFDLSVWKTIDNGTPERMKEVDVLLDIRVPFDGAGKKNIAVYRYHDDTAAKLPSVSEGSNTEGFWFDEDNGYIHIYTYSFSTYAIGYTERTASGGNGNYYVPVEEKPAEEKPIEVPKTFDAGIGLAVTVTVLGTTGSAWLLKKKED